QGDDKSKGEAEAKAAALQDAAKARLKTAFESAAAGNKMDPKSADVALALADYYRAARSRVNESRELKRAALLKADDARIAFVQGQEGMTVGKRSTLEEEYFVREDAERIRQLHLEEMRRLAEHEKAELRRLHHGHCSECGWLLVPEKLGDVAVFHCLNCGGAF